jgi:hypothetical protein
MELLAPTMTALSVHGDLTAGEADLFSESFQA